MRDPRSTGRSLVPAPAARISRATPISVRRLNRREKSAPRDGRRTSYSSARRPTIPQSTSTSAPTMSSCNRSQAVFRTRSGFVVLILAKLEGRSRLARQ